MPFHFQFISPTNTALHIPAVTRRHGPLLVFGHFVFEPFHHVMHLGVDSKPARRGTAVAPAGHALQVIPAAFLARHRPPWISLTGVDAALVQTGADHRVVDLPGVGFFTAGVAGHGDRNLLEEGRSGPARREAAPTSDPALLAVTRSLDTIGQTGQVDVPIDNNNAIVMSKVSVGERDEICQTDLPSLAGEASFSRAMSWA